MPEAVTLHIYDVFGHEVARGLNNVLKATGTGAFHAAVEVMGVEYSYGFQEEGTGVFTCPPKGCEGHSYRESHPMGETRMSVQQLASLLDRMQAEWPGADYDLLRHNCCHFSDTFCKELGVGPIPAWVTNLAGAGATLHGGASRAATGAQSAAIIAMAKAGEIDEKYQVREKVATGATGVLDTVVAFDQQHKVTEKVATGAQGLLQRVAQLDQQYKVSDQVSAQAARVAQAPAAQGLLQRAAGLDQQYEVTGKIEAGKEALRANAEKLISEGKAARAADGGSGYQFGDLTRGLLGRLSLSSGGSASGSGGHTGAAAGGAGGAGAPPVAPQPTNETQTR